MLPQICRVAILSNCFYICFSVKRNVSCFLAFQFIETLPSGFDRRDIWRSKRKKRLEIEGLCDTKEKWLRFEEEKSVFNWHCYISKRRKLYAKEAIYKDNEVGCKYYEDLCQRCESAVNIGKNEKNLLYLLFSAIKNTDIYYYFNSFEFLITEIFNCKNVFIRLSILLWRSCSLSLE